MEQLSTELRGKRRAKFLLGGGAVAVLVVLLLAWAMGRPGATSFFKTVGEVKALGPAAAGEQYRVNGDLVSGTLEKDGIKTVFDITDGKDSITVVTDEALPDAAWTDTKRVEIVAQGSFNGSTFVASNVLAKCPSKFTPKQG